MFWLGVKCFSHPTDLSEYKKMFWFAVEHVRLPKALPQGELGCKYHS